MKQVLHIFSKDCRRYWPEVLVSLAVLGAFVWIYPYMWRDDFSLVASFGFLAFDLTHLLIAANVVAVLVPVSWLLLIARVVHGENLVGNRQFWVTRPYVWQNLLTEKLLFVATFVCIPFCVAQACLLARAGFHPTHYLGNLAYSLLLIVAFAILPMFALSTVFSSLMRMIGVTLVLCVIVLALAFLSSTAAYHPSTAVPLVADRIWLPMVFAFCGAVLVAQYSARNLWLSRSLLVAMLLTLTLFASSPFEIPLL
jgi:hypothetical protein